MNIKVKIFTQPENREREINEFIASQKDKINQNSVVSFPEKIIIWYNDESKEDARKNLMIESLNQHFNKLIGERLAAEFTKRNASRDVAKKMGGKERQEREIQQLNDFENQCEKKDAEIKEMRNLIEELKAGKFVL